MNILDRGRNSKRFARGVPDCFRGCFGVGFEEGNDLFDFLEEGGGFGGERVDVDDTVAAGAGDVGAGGMEGYVLDGFDGVTETEGFEVIEGVDDTDAELPMGRVG